MSMIRIDRSFAGGGAFGPSTFGTPPNYAEFESDGTLVFYGNATCWRDELQSLIGARLESPASDITRNIAEGSLTFESTARYPTDYVTVNHQLNHDWVDGTSIDPHLHWWQVSSSVPNWLIGYRWQRQGQAKTTAWTELPWASNAFTYSSGTLNQISGFGSIVPPAGYGEVSDIVQYRIYRDVTNASGEFAGAEAGPVNIDAVNFDTHIQVNMLGSRQEYVK